MGSSKQSVVGYKYYLGMHLAICHGPVDEVQKFIVGEREAWSGSVTSTGSVTVDAPNLFGGDQKEGGVAGTVDVLMGDETQTKNSYLMDKISSAIPAFRGVLSLVLNQCYVSAMSPYPKAWAVKVKRCAGRSWYAAKCDINGSSNAPHIIYEALSNPDWGIGYPISQIDDATFQLAADQLYSEGFGLSFILAGQQPIEDFIKDILNVVHGVLYTDRTTGKFKLKLIRDDYDEGTLDIFDESNILELTSFERPQPAEMVNEVIIKYRPQGAVADTSTTVQDLAMVQAQQGIVSQTFDYTHIDTAEIAAKVGMRELKQHSTPLAQVQFTANRDGWVLDPGAVAKFSWESLNISEIVLRILSVDGSGLADGSIIVNAIEDIFGLPTSSYIGNQGTAWTNPVGLPVASPNQMDLELTYWDIQQYMASPDSVPDDGAIHQMTAQKPSQASPGYDLWTATTTGGYSFVAAGTWSYYAELSGSLDYTTTTDIDITNWDSELQFFPLDHYAYIGDEIVRVDSIDTVTGKITVGRGCLDTIATEHPAGEKIYFVENRGAVDPANYFIGETRRGKVFTKTGSGILSEGDAPTTQITFVGRQFKPYPPGKFRINSLTYPTAKFGATVLLTPSWAHRDRTLQLNRPMTDEASASIGPETGVTYTLKFYDEGDVLRKTETGLTGTSYTWTTEATDSGLSRLNESVRIELYSVRDGEDSYQIHNFTVWRELAPVNLTLPVASGGTSEGSLLSVTDGTWDFSPTSFTYQWVQELVNIPLATNNTYTVVAGDAGHDIACKVTAINGAGSQEEFSNYLTMDPPAIPPVNVTPPVISGDTPEGSTLTTTNGVWDNSPTSYTYEWQRTGVAIPLATSQTYDTVSADIGEDITCEVTAINAYGSATAESNIIVPTAIAGDQFTAKSIILDITDNWGDVTYLDLRSIDFYFQGAKLALIGTDFVAQATTTLAGYSAEYVFDTTLSKIGSPSGQAWFSTGSNVANQRISCVFNSEITFDKVVINNGHTNGASTSRGCKNVVITISDDSISSTVFEETITTPTVIFDGILAEHFELNDEDPATLLLPFPGDYSFKSVVFDFADNYSSDVNMGLRHVDFIRDGEVINIERGQFEAVATSEGNAGKHVYTAKSFIMDCTNNYGDIYMGMRQVDFWYNGVKIAIVAADLTGYSTTLYGGADVEVEYIFDTTTSKTGSTNTNGWLSNSVATNQRIIAVFNTPIVFDEVRINNYHATGIETDRGVQDVVIKISDNSITSTVFEEAIAASTLIFDGTFAEHSVSDTEDEEILELISPYAFVAKSVIIDIADNYGDSYMGFRQCDFYYKGTKVVLQEATDFTAYNTSNYPTTTLAKYGFDTDTDYVGAYSYNAWMSNNQSTNQRVIIVVDTDLVFDEIRINNFHGTPSGGGGNTDRGIKNFKIHISSDAITNTTYDASITNSALIFDGSILEHPVTDTRDDQTLSLITSGLEQIYARSFVMDIADQWGDVTYMGFRSVEFYLNGVLYPLIASDFIATATSTLVAFSAEYVFDTTEPKDGNASGNSWYGASGQITNQRLVCVFNTPILIDKIVINNSHSYGASTNRGAKNTKIYVSDDVITSEVYGETVPNSSLIFDSIIPEHAAVDAADDVIMSLLPTFCRAIFPFLTSGSKTGGVGESQWMSDSTITNQRLLISFRSLFTFDGITINNAHVLGNLTDRGVQNVVINGSPDDEISNTSYDGAITTPTLLFDDVFTQHPATDTASDEILTFIVPSLSVTAKTIIIDILDNWGHGTYIGIRSIEFYFEGSLISVAPADGKFYSTTVFNSSYIPVYSFDTSLSKIGSFSFNQWLSISGEVTNQRLAVIFDTPITFDEIVINNGHNSGGLTNQGAKNIIVTASDYELENINFRAEQYGGTVILQTEVAEHVAADTVDDQSFPLSQIPFGLYGLRSIAFDIANNYGNSTFLGIRSIEFIKDGKLVWVHPINGEFLATSQYTTSYIPGYTFDISKSKIGTSIATQWLAGSALVASQRLLANFTQTIDFDSIVYNNGHTSGGIVDQGAQNVKVNITPEVITDNTYDAVITRALEVFNGTLTQHPATDTIQDATLPLASPVPWASTIPTVTGVAAVGETITCTQGTWQNSPTGYTYQWQRNGVNISLATVSVYTYAFADIGTDLTCVVTATNSNGSQGVSSEPLEINPDPVLLVHSNTTNGDTVFTDSSLFGRTITSLATHVTAEHKFGTTSMVCSQTSYISVADSDDFSFGTGDFTVDFWVKRTAASLGTRRFIAGQCDAGAAIGSISLLFEFATNNILTLGVGYSASWTQIAGTTATTDELWHHIAAVQVSGTVKLFLDGKFQASLVPGAPIRDSSSVWSFGRCGAYASLYFIGWIDEMRIIKGTAAWTDEFTPRRVAYPDPIAPSYTAKSIILDFANGWGSRAMAIRSVEFSLGATPIEILAANVTCYVVNSHVLFPPVYAFDTSLSKTGAQTGNEWITNSGYHTNQRLICVFDATIEFDRITINNRHHSGADTGYGVKDTEIYYSTDTITDTTYGATISNSVKIFDGTIAIHVSADVVDDQVLTLI